MLLMLMGWFSATLQAQSYAKLWKQVEQAQEKSLPQTVIRLTDQIYNKARKENNAGQMLKAYVLRQAQQEQLTPDSLYTHIAELESRVQTEENVVNRAILHSLLAEQYNDLMRTNRYALRQRPSLGVEEVPADLREWSANLFIDRIDRHSRAALQDADALIDMDNTSYLPFVEQEDGSRFYGHDMYHLLTTRAIEAYGLFDDFGADTLMTSAIRRIHQDRIHRYTERAGRKDAALLSRMDYLEWQNAQNLLSFAAYGEQLDSLMSDYADRPLCAEVYLKKARWIYSDSYDPHPAEALRLCEEAIKRYADYPRINALKELRERILQPLLQMNTPDEGYPGDSVDMTVSHRLLKGFTLRIYSTDYAQCPDLEDGITQSVLRQHARLLGTTHYDLRPEDDGIHSMEDKAYLTSRTTLRMRMPEALGVFIVQVVPDGYNNLSQSHFLTTTRFKALMLDLGNGQVELTTLDARSGHPIGGATVSIYGSSYRSQSTEPLKKVTTDAKGKAVVSWTKKMSRYTVRKDDDRAMNIRRVSGATYVASTSTWERRLTLLTDRSIYRPGQTIYVKGVAYEQLEQEVRVRTEANYELVLLDVNGKELSARNVRTNEYGSFAAEFVLPDACLNGNFRLQTRKHEAVKYIRVEEYKRPTFTIDFDPVSEAYLLGDSIVLKGRVQAFNGMAVQDVPLAYRMVSHVVLPRYFRIADEHELVADTVQLDADGRFAIPLVLRDLSAKLNGSSARSQGRSTWQQQSLFEIEVTVTDGAGETQTASYSLTADKLNAYQVNLQLPSTVCKEDSLIYTLHTLNYVGAEQDVQLLSRLYTDDGKTLVREETLSGNGRHDFSAWRALPSGKYQLKLSVIDPSGRKVGQERTDDFVLFSKTDTRPAAFTNRFYWAENEEFDAEHPASFLFGTSFKDAYVLLDVFSFENRRRLESRVMQLSDSIVRMEFPYQEAYGEGATVLLCFVKDGRSYEKRIQLKKRQPERTLQLKWEVFRDRLRPGQDEEWRLVVKNPQGLPAAAEVLALMYDASLDKLSSHNQSLEVLTYITPANVAYWRSYDTPSTRYFQFTSLFPSKSWKVFGWSFDRFYQAPIFLQESYVELASVRSVGGVYRQDGLMMSAPRTTRQNVVTASKMSMDVTVEEEAAGKLQKSDVADASEDNDASRIYIRGTQNEEDTSEADALRTNFAETAFFYPQLRTNEQGELAIAFTLPESLTRWNFQAYAHTQTMLTGRLNATVVSAKEFMLTPNLPRFVRVGDKTQVTATLANLSERTVKGTAKLVLFDPLTEKNIATQKQKFTVEAGRTAVVTFAFEADERYDLLGVRLVADGGSFSDGEQHLLPVLSNKEYITETLPMPVRGKETRTFTLDSLFNRQSRTATNRRLTVEFTGNPAWYAVQALPVLSQPTSENAISWATMLYANTLAGYIANSQPRIKTMFDSWKASGTTGETLLSKLEQNQDVKNILLTESPWLTEATSESERQARLVTLFDLNVQSNRLTTALTRLKELQTTDGSWSWFKGMPGSRYTTTYVTKLLVRLPLLTGKSLSGEALSMKKAAFNFLHQEALEEYRNILKSERKGIKITNLSDAALTYLYLIATDGATVPSENKEAYNYFLSLVGNNLTSSSMSRKAQSAVVLLKAGRKSEAQDFVVSLCEHLVQEDEMGAHFAFYDTPYTWSELLLPTHVSVMEALRLAGGKDALVEEMKLWLLKQKQTNAWDSPVATADAVYALLCQGSDLLSSQGDARITIGKKVLQTVQEDVEVSADATSEATSDASVVVPGFSYLKETFQDNSTVGARSITVEKRDEGIAWGAVYAQYLSPISDVRQHGGALSVEKKLYVERLSADGKKSLQPIEDATPLSVGDKVVSRLTIRVDRAMEFVQLKDGRGACFEPVNALSGYRWGRGLGYYVEIKDAVTNFFFDHLGKGVYVLEYAYRVARAGRYETGIATMQCAYAPEYASHSAGGTVTIDN